MAKKNILYAQSGGPTAVINATACGVIEAARESRQVAKVFAAKNGILGALHEELIDTSKESATTVARLRHTPASAFGSCRYKLKSLDANRREYERLIKIFEAHNIGYFFYNGGGDSQDSAHKVSLVSQQMNYPIRCIGLPKTVDNDLPFTDHSPGFGSVAKYIATSIREAGLDVASMAATSTKVFILEVMGRHAGWIAAAAGLASQEQADAPHIILFPEIAFEADKFLKKVAQKVKKYGFCTIAVSEGVRNKQGKFLSSSGLADAFGHKQLGGVAPILAQLIQEQLGYKYHWAVADYLQRAARHIASKVDVEQAYQLGRTAVSRAVAGDDGVMLTIERKKLKQYKWKIGSVPLHKVANVEKTMPRNFITRDGFHITDACREYMTPLIVGEDYPPYKHGLPQYAKLKQVMVAKKLPRFKG